MKILTTNLLHKKHDGECKQLFRQRSVISQKTTSIPTVPTLLYEYSAGLPRTTKIVQLFKKV
jgi:hypothetical protein